MTPHPDNLPIRWDSVRRFPVAGFGSLHQRLLSRCLVLLGLVTLLAGCERSEQEKARLAEEQRIRCSDARCPGDRVPEVDWTKYVVFKRHGQWYTAPEEYGNPDARGFVVFWPSKTPMLKYRLPESKNGEAPVFDQTMVEVFLTGRLRWPEPNAVNPWEQDSWGRLTERLNRRGYHQQERRRIRAGLEEVRFLKPDDPMKGHIIYLATNGQKPMGAGKPLLICDLYVINPRTAVCTGGEFWFPDVYADYRVALQHATDWPEIYQEISRIRQQTRKLDK